MGRPTKENVGKLVDTKKDILNLLVEHDEARTMTNKELAKKFWCHPVYLSKCLADMQRQGFISMSYTGGSRGVRIIEVLKTN